MSVILTTAQDIYRYKYISKVQTKNKAERERGHYGKNLHPSHTYMNHNGQPHQILTLGN